MCERDREILINRVCQIGNAFYITNSAFGALKKKNSAFGGKVKGSAEARATKSSLVPKLPSQYYLDDKNASAQSQ